MRYANGVTELYDLGTDPYELENLAGRPEVAGRERGMSRQLAVLRSCSGETCH